MSDPSDFYEVERLLDAEERDLLHTVRKTLRATVTPMVTTPHLRHPVATTLAIEIGSRRCHPRRMS